MSYQRLREISHPQAKEGLIEEGSAVWQELSKGDQEKRARANKDKATKLRSPNFYVSTTRLSLRNLPFSMDEKGLKTLLIAAVSQSASIATLPPCLNSITCSKQVGRKRHTMERRLCQDTADDKGYGGLD